MARYAVDKVLVRSTRSSVIEDTPHGVCPACLEQLEVKLRQLLIGVPFDFDNTPYSYVVVSVRQKLTTRRRGQISDLILAAIAGCDDSHWPLSTG